MTYSRVVFEALLMSQKGDETQDISVLKDDLTHIGRYTIELFLLVTHLEKVASVSWNPYIIYFKCQKP